VQLPNQQPITTSEPVPGMEKRLAGTWHAGYGAAAAPQRSGLTRVSSGSTCAFVSYRVIVSATSAEGLGWALSRR
jgi:hypothetical protein